jgi:hypothetical protein
MKLIEILRRVQMGPKRRIKMPSGTPKPSTPMTVQPKMTSAGGAVM